jgi:hypothetical protein
MQGLKKKISGNTGASFENYRNTSMLTLTPPSTSSVIQTPKVIDTHKSTTAPVDHGCIMNFLILHLRPGGKAHAKL